MSVAEFLTAYGEGGILVALLGIVLWFARRVVEAVDRISIAVAEQGKTHHGEVKAIAHAHREEVTSILDAHTVALREQGERFDRTILMLAKGLITTVPPEANS